MTKIAWLLLLVPLLYGCGEQTHPQENSAGAGLAAQSSQPETKGDARLISLTPKAATLAKITDSTVKYKVIPVTVEASAEVSENLNSVVKVNSVVNGIVSSVDVKSGDMVSKGHLLTRIRSQDVEQIESDLLQQRGEVKADLSQALLDIDAQLEGLNAQLALSKSSYERSNKLFEEEIDSRAELESTKTTYVKNQIDIAVQVKKRVNTIRIFNEKLALITEPIKDKLSLLGVSDAQISRLINRGTIEPIVEVRSPTCGLVSQRKVNPGEVVQSGQQLFTVGDYSTVWLTAQIHEKDIHKIGLGQPITLRCDSYPDKTFDGHLNYISDSVDKETRTLLVRAEVDNAHRLLKPQMYANMTIIVSERRMLTVSKSALQDAGPEKVIYISLGNDQFREVPVRVGARCGDQFEILAGLKEGDLVVDNGSFELRSKALSNLVNN